MVDVNPGTSALQAQLQASKAKGKITPRALSATGDSAPASPQDVIGKRIAARTDIPSPDRRVPAKTGNNSTLSTAAEIDDAGFRIAEFTGSNREAPLGRISNESPLARNQPLGQIINILV